MRAELRHQFTQLIIANENVEISDDEDEIRKAEKIMEDLEMLKAEVLDKAQRIAKTQEEQRRLKLPTIEPPKFDGQYRKWPLFERSFEEMIVFNQGLAETEKSAYLLSALEGNPRKDFEKYRRTNGSFLQNWQLLVKTYNNIRKVAQDLVRQIKKTPQVYPDSSEGIRMVHASLESSLQGLEEMGIDTSSWDIWIYDAIQTSLDKESARQFETEFEATTNVPGKEAMLDFLIRRQH